MDPGDWYQSPILGVSIPHTSPHIIANGGSVQTLEWALGGLVTLYLIMLCSWCIFLQQKTEQVPIFFYRVLHLLLRFLLC